MEREPEHVVVTGVIPYGDSDCVVRLFGRASGRVGAFARKARQSRKRFPGLSAPALGRATLVERRGAELFELRELEVDPVVLGLAVDLRGLGHASYLCELIDKLVPEAEPSAEIFDVVHEAISRIARTGPSAVLLRAVELKLLLHTGFLPDLWQPDAAAFSDDERHAAIGLVQAPLDGLPALDDATLRSVSRLFGAHLRTHAGAPLRSVQFLASLAEGNAPVSLAGPARSR